MNKNKLLHFFKFICLCSIVPLCTSPFLALTACDNTKIHFAYVNSDGSTSPTILYGHSLKITVSSSNAEDEYVWSGYTTSSDVTISISGQRNEQMTIANHNSITADIDFTGICATIEGKSKKTKRIINRPQNITVFNYVFSYPGDTINHVTYGSYVTITPLSYWYPNSNYEWAWLNLVEGIVDSTNGNVLQIYNGLITGLEEVYINAWVTDGGGMVTYTDEMTFLPQ